MSDLIPQDQEILDKILQKEEAALTPNDIAILKGRRSYISGDDKARYPGVFKGKKADKIAKGEGEK